MQNKEKVKRKKGKRPPEASASWERSLFVYLLLPFYSFACLFVPLFVLFYEYENNCNQSISNEYDFQYSGFHNYKAFLRIYPPISVSSIF